MDRGHQIHLCWNRFLETGHPGNAGKWGEWVGILCEHPFWSKLQPLALEYELCDRTHWIAGKLDGLFYHKETKEVILIDLKTTEEKYDESKKKWVLNKGSHHRQLGGYIDLLYINFPDLWIDKCFICYSTQHQVKFDPYENIEDCRGKYQLAREAYFQKQRKLHSF